MAIFTCLDCVILFTFFRLSNAVKGEAVIKIEQSLIDSVSLSFNDAAVDT